MRYKSFLLYESQNRVEILSALVRGIKRMEYDTTTSLVKLKRPRLKTTVVESMLVYLMGVSKRWHHP